MQVTLNLFVTGYHPEVVICSINNLFVDCNDADDDISPSTLPNSLYRNEYFLQIFFWQTGECYQLSLSNVSFVFQKFWVSEPSILLRIESPKNDIRQHLLRVSSSISEMETESLVYLQSIQDDEYCREDDLYEFYKYLLKAQAAELSIPMRSIMGMEELVRTEEAYVKDLNTFVDVFVVPFEEAIHVKLLPNDLLADVLPSVFQDWIQLTSLHMEFLQVSHFIINPRNDTSSCKQSLYWNMLEQVQTRQQFIGALIANRLCVEWKQPYIDYISNYDIRNKRLCCLREKDAVLNDFIRRCEASPKCQGLCFTSFLIKPVQRVTKYDLLLREIETGCNCPYQEARLAIRELLSTIEQR